MTVKLILASQSPYRRQQLENFGLNFEAIAPAVNEEELKAKGPRDLTELTRYLAEQKARSLSPRYPETVILGSDQLVELDGQRLDKPGSPQNAAEQLRQMSGKEHRLITSLALVKGDSCLLYTDITKVKFKALDAALIEAYVRTDNPVDCAGSYKIEKAGLSLIESLITEDPSAIQGLPMMSLLRGLEKWNIQLAQLWRQANPENK